VNGTPKVFAALRIASSLFTQFSSAPTYFFPKKQTVRLYLSRAVLLMYSSLKQRTENLYAMAESFTIMWTMRGTDFPLTPIQTQAKRL
jgi:hypothetical protein